MNINIIDSPLLIIPSISVNIINIIIIIIIIIIMHVISVIIISIITMIIVIITIMIIASVVVIARSVLPEAATRGLEAESAVADRLR